MSRSSNRGPYTVEDWLAQPEDAAFELIDGHLIPKAAPRMQHGRLQARVAGPIMAAFDRAKGAPDHPAGWWIGTEVDVALGDDIFRPDVAGWRRERLPELSDDWPVAVRPDWLCEIVSNASRTDDTVNKLRRCFEAGVPHYWIVDRVRRSLTVHRHTADGYLIALVADARERVRAEPFDAIELHIAVLLGDDPDE